MRLFRSHEQIRRAELKTIGWFFTAMALLTVTFGAIVAVHYLLGWW
jgi:hypothetical protein